MSDAPNSGERPKTGMRRIPFPLESYEHPSPPLSTRRLVNLMAEQEPSDARTAAALVPTPGLSVYKTVGTGPVRAINSDLPGIVYFASGDHFYRMFYSTGVVTDLGYIGTPAMDTAGHDTLITTIAVGPTAAVVCVPPNAYTCSHEGPINQIGGDYPGAYSVAYLDGYFVFVQSGDSGRWFISGLFDPLSYDALDFAYADAAPNVARLVIAHRGEIWLLGEGAIEIWRDSGDADFPFRRQSGGVIWVGCADSKSVARIDGSVWWLGTDHNVYRSNGYRAQRVSTHAIEAIIHGDFGELVCGLAYVQEGHTFYAITLATRTLVYDCLTQAWHERSSSTDGSLAWRPRSASNATALLLFGDNLSGKVFEATPRLETDDGIPLIRQFISPPLWAMTRRAFCARLELEMETGRAYTPGDVRLEWSDDGGINWTGGPRTMNAGAPSDLRKRVYATRLGSFRQRVFRVTAVGRATFYALDADIAAGEH